MKDNMIKCITMILIAVLVLTACASDRREQPKENAGNKTVAVKREAKLAQEFTDKSYPFCNSTNLYKMSDRYQAEDDGVSLIQYDLKGNNRKEIVLHGKDAAESLISVNDQWIYYEYYPKNNPAVCRIPITKKDGCDVIDPSLEEILFYPEKRTKEEKAQGIIDKSLSYEGGYWVTSKYVLYFVALDYEEKDEYVDELVRYDLETGETATRIYEMKDVGDNSMGICISQDESKIVYGDEKVNVLDVETMEVQKLTGYEPGSYAISSDYSIFACSEDDEVRDDEDAARVYLYSLSQGGCLALASSYAIRNVICEAEGIDAQNILHISNGILGCYGEKAYMRYLVEYSQGEDCVACYGVIGMSLTENGDLSFEREITQAIRQESTENKGQWKQYHRYTKKERKKAEKAGRKLEKKVDRQHQVTVNFGNPQRVIGNQLFCRSVNLDMSQNHWFCINLDTGDQEEVDREDIRYQWIYCEDADGWEAYYEGNYFVDDFTCLEDDELAEVVWGQEGNSNSTGTVQGEKGAVTVREQLQYLAEHRYAWLNEVGQYEGELFYYDEFPMGAFFGTLNYYSGVRYMVSDLNQNGQLEIITLDMAGTGQFTYIWGYEFSEKTHKLKAIDMGKGVYGIPDIGNRDKSSVYYDREKDRYWYYGVDFVHGSAVDNWNHICLWCVSRKSKFQSRYYGRMGYEYGNNELQYMLNEKKVTKKEFEQKEKNMEPGMKKGKATFRWQKDRENLVEMSDEELLERLTESWKGFSVK